MDAQRSRCLFSLKGTIIWCSVACSGGLQRSLLMDISLVSPRGGPLRSASAALAGAWAVGLGPLRFRIAKSYGSNRALTILDLVSYTITLSSTAWPLDCPRLFLQFA